jgi:hypothetical protein
MKNFLLLSSIIFFFCIEEDVHAQCKNSEFSIETEKKEAEAGALGNFWGSKNSLNAIVMQVVDNSFKGFSSAKPEGCGEKCSSSEAQKRIRVTPTSRLSDYAEKEACQKYLDQTTSSPLHFVSPDFSNKDEFGEWFADLSQGKGQAGKKLYRLCPGKCSPSYSVVLEDKEANNYLAKVSAVCGHARNKSDNKYQVISEYFWQCKE